MSGLLRRLASQALRGGPPEVRPVARLAYPAPAEPTPAPADLPPRTAPSTPPADSGRDDANSVALTRRTAAEIPARADRRERPEPREALEERGRSYLPDAFQAAPPDAAAGPPPSIPRNEVAVGTGEPGHGTTAPWPPATRPAPAPEAPRRTTSAPPPAPSPRPPTAFRPPAALVDRTSPPVPSPPIVRSRTDPAMRVERRSSDTEPTEVHVHIGRIEVTAVHDTPPTRERKRTAPKPMSLDQYLAKRRGRTG
jgi:hypothetical protein